MNNSMILKLASYYEKLIKKLANTQYPTSENVHEIIENVIKSHKSNPALSGFINTSKPDVQNTIDNTTFVYFQLVVKPETYEQLAEDPAKTEISNLLKPAVEQALKSNFGAFNFRVKIGVVPV